ncbi:MAG: beta-N-acetylhexosaminidase [Rhodospirillaceae bacterium]|mgnify:CR=1 FL=1|nr:beta-N-acetylhexosaminidase [Rhodospirillaceae bacterium]
MSNPGDDAPAAVIFGCIDTVLTEAEADLFSECNPFGLILFEHNCVDPSQLKDLIAQFRQTVGRDDAPILIDQEGGRVTRMKPPHWRHPPPARVFAELAESDMESASRAAYLNARLIGQELAEVGISVDCLPVLDIPVVGAHEVIGDRALGRDPETIGQLGKAMSEGIMAEGVLPIIKHIPGHGRAKSDSHKELPIVDTTRVVLESTDFRPFVSLANMPWAMTAHVVYTAIDDIHAATISPEIIENIIRKEIGFEGLLLSDDIGMEALSGTKGERAQAILTAGCDLALECSGKIDDMTEVASIIPQMSNSALKRANEAEKLRVASLANDGLSSETALKELEDLMREHRIDGG